MESVFLFKWRSVNAGKIENYTPSYRNFLGCVHTRMLIFAMYSGSLSNDLETIRSHSQLQKHFSNIRDFGAFQGVM